MRLRPSTGLALVAIAVTLMASACVGSPSPDGATRSGTGVVTATAAPEPDGPTPEQPQLATGSASEPTRAERPASGQSAAVMAELLRWVSSANAELVQYRLGLHVACSYGDAAQCWDRLHFSATVGSWIVADLTRVSDRPAEVTLLWSRTYQTALALQGVAGRSCGSGRDLDGCKSAVGVTVARLSGDLSGWGVYATVQ